MAAREPYGFLPINPLHVKGQDDKLKRYEVYIGEYDEKTRELRAIHRIDVAGGGFAKDLEGIVAHPPATVNLQQLFGDYQPILKDYFKGYGQAPAVKPRPSVIPVASIGGDSRYQILGMFDPWENAIYLLANPGPHDPNIVSTHEHEHALVERQPGDKTIYQSEGSIDESVAARLGNAAANRFSPDQYR